MGEASLHQKTNYVFDDCVLKTLGVLCTAQSLETDPLSFPLRHPVVLVRSDADVVSHLRTTDGARSGRSCRHHVEARRSLRDLGPAPPECGRAAAVCGRPA